MDRLDAMRIFVAVSKLGSFSEAARQLRISASVATRSIAQLEDQLGLVLLTRTTRALRLTERGSVFRESCEQILEEIDAAERRVRGEDARPRGELKIAAPIVFGRLHLLPIVGQLLKSHENLSIRLALSDRNVHLVDEGIDVAVRVGELADSGMIATKLAEVRRVVVASPAYLDTRGTPTTPGDLAAHDLIAFENLDTMNEWRFADGESARVVPRLAVNSADAAIMASEMGLGITRTLNYQVRDAVRAGRLRPVLEKFAPAASPVSAIYPSRRIGSANVAAFVKAARTHFGASPLGPN